MDPQRRIALAAAIAVAGTALAPTLAHAERWHATRHAIEALRDARADLLNAHHEFGGHRARAIEAIDAAIHELRESIAWADAHGL